MKTSVQKKVRPSLIGWTGPTWNVAVGCTKVSEECKFCYMMRDHGPGQFMSIIKEGKAIEVNGTVTRTSKSTFNRPLIWQKKGPESWPDKGVVDGKLLVFTSSLTDFFHEEIDSYRHEAWNIIRQCPDLIFQILTKRSDRIADCLPDDWGENGYSNVWLGVSVGTNKALKRIDDLHAVPARRKFVSFEPLLEAIDTSHRLLCFGSTCPSCGSHNGVISGVGEEYCHTECGDCGDVSDTWFSQIDWAIIGGESGNKTGNWGYRECNLTWIESLINQCKKAKVKVFVKQLGTHLSEQLLLQKVRTGKAGVDLSNLPDDLNFLNLREIPNA